MSATSTIARKVMNNKGKVTGNLFNIGLGVYFSADTYSEARESGASPVGAALSAVGDFALSNMLGWKSYLAMNLLPSAGSLAVDLYDGINAYGRNLDRMGNALPFSNSTFIDTQQTYTMRQAGMNLAKQSKYNIQQAMMGDEARMTYR